MKFNCINAPMAHLARAPRGLQSLLLAALVMAPFSAHAATYNVTSTDDAGPNTLRAAIALANGTTADDSITFAVTSAITLTSGDLMVNGASSAGKLSISGVAANGSATGATISGGGNWRIFNLKDGADVTLSNLTLRDGNGVGVGGNSGSSGGAIKNNGGMLTITDSTLANNSTSNGGGGGAIFNDNGTLVITSSTLSGNSASGSGGGVFSFTLSATDGQPDPAQFVLISNSTFVGNSAGGNGGAVYDDSGLIRVESSTIAGNSAPLNQGAGVAAYGDGQTRLRVQNSIIADNRITGGGADSGSDVSFVSDTTNSIVSRGNNAIGDGNAASSFNQTGDQRGVTAATLKLADLASNGGPTQTRALLEGSVAIDAGATDLALDQRGTTRPQGVAKDIGAFEFKVTPDPTGSAGLIVTTKEDIVRADGLISLREAITTANTDATASAITFDATVFSSPQTITLNGTQLPDLANDGAVSITGSAAGVTISGDAKSGIVNVAIGANATLASLTLSNGKSVNGGAIFNRGTLAITGSTFTGNVADANAGAIRNNSNATLTVANSTFTSNSAATNGGAIRNDGTLTVTNSTLTGNTAGGGGSGIRNLSTLNLFNTLVVGNTTDDVNGSISSSSNNNITTGTAAASGLDPAGLADNGGPTQTIALLTRGTAVNKGSNAAASALTTEQRGAGFPRIVGGTVDIGAYESTFANRLPLLNNSTYSTTLNLPFSQQLAGSDPDGDALTYARSAGALPTGLSLSSSGLISGTPTVAGQFAFSVNVNDGNDTLTARFIIIVSAMADAIGPNVSRPALNANYTRDDLAALIYQGTVTDVAAGGATPSGVKQLLFQLRRESDKTAYSGPADGFTTNVNRGYYSALLSDPVPNTTAGARPFKRTFSTFIPPASVLTVGPYSLVIAAQDVAGNWSIEVVPINIVAAPPVSRLKPATPSVSSGASVLRSSKSASGGGS